MNELNVVTQEEVTIEPVANQNPVFNPELIEMEQFNTNDNETNDNTSNIDNVTPDNDNQEVNESDDNESDDNTSNVDNVIPDNDNQEVNESDDNESNNVNSYTLPTITVDSEFLPTIPNWHHLNNIDSCEIDSCDYASAIVGLSVLTVIGYTLYRFLRR